MNKLTMLYAIPNLHPELPDEEKKALVWAHKMLTDIRLRELYSNLKNYDFDLLGTYKMDENEAGKIMAVIENIHYEDGDEDG